MPRLNPRRAIRSVLPRLAVLGLALLAASCSDPVAPASPTPVEATITEVTIGVRMAERTTPAPLVSCCSSTARASERTIWMGTL